MIERLAHRRCRFSYIAILDRIDSSKYFEGHLILFSFIALNCLLRKLFNLMLKLPCHFTLQGDSIVSIILRTVHRVGGFTQVRTPGIRGLEIPCFLRPVRLDVLVHRRPIYSDLRFDTCY